MIIENPQTRLRSRSFILTEQDLAEAIKDYVEKKISDRTEDIPKATHWKISFICDGEIVRVERIEGGGEHE